MSHTHFIPAHRNPTVTRPRLIDRALGGDPALIILRGRGGTGKTIAASQIAHAFARARPGAHAVWVRSVPAQAGPGLLWQHVLGALGEAGVLDPARARQFAEGGVLSTAAVTSALAALSAPVLLVVEDAHELMAPEASSSVLEVLAQTQLLTLLLTSRTSLPGLVSVRARMQVPVRELSGGDLALSAGEIEELIGARLGMREGAGALAGRIYSETRGWPLAVHALLVEREMNIDDHFSAPDAPRAEGRFVRDYVDEMLAQAAPLTAAIACAIGIFGQATPDILARILDTDPHEITSALNTSLDLEHWVDDAGAHWYQHPEIVGAELRRRREEVFDAAELAAIAARAARAYRQDRPRIALQAAILARDWEWLSELLLEGSTFSLTRSQLPFNPAQLPEAVHARYPVLAAFALFHEYAFPTGRLGKMIVGARVLASRSLAAETAKPGLPGIVAAMLKMVVARLSGNERLALAMAEHVYERIDQLAGEEFGTFGEGLQVGINQVAITLIYAGRIDAADDLLATMRAWPGSRSPGGVAHGIGLAAWAKAWTGDMVGARTLIRECTGLDTPVGWKNAYIGSGYRIAAALDRLEHGEAAAAVDHLDALAEHEPTIEHWPYLAYLRALAAETERGPQAALEVLQTHAHRRRGQPGMLPSAKRMLAELRARLAWQSGKVLPPGKRRAKVDLVAVYGALSRAENSLAAALAAQISADQELAGAPRMRAEALLLRAEALRREGEQNAAVDAARSAADVLEFHALALPMRALPQGSAVALVELGADLPVEHSTEVAVREIQPLSAAEQRALREVFEQGSVPAAAKSLYLSQDTIKSHMKTVYRKLGVRNRKDAIRIASEAGLLSPRSGED